MVARNTRLTYAAFLSYPWGEGVPRADHRGGRSGRVPIARGN
jgi:hypothetical protein